MNTNMILGSVGTTMGTTPDIDEIRVRAHHFLTPEVAAVANMSLHDLTQFTNGTFTPSDAQLRQLALRMGFGS